MGIQGLLPALKSITERVHLDELKGETAGIDGYSWLHKGVHVAAVDLLSHRPALFQHSGEEMIGEADEKRQRMTEDLLRRWTVALTPGVVEHCMQRTKQLMNHGVRPYVVFDGAPLPSKAGKEEERRESRHKALQRLLLAVQGNDLGSASSWLARCIDVTPAMAAAWIARLRPLHVAFVVAPYEADAQLAWLAYNNVITVAIAEDSDLLVYGLPRVVFKLDRSGVGEQIQLCRLGDCRELDLTRFSPALLRHMCILAGCDYVESPQGIGLRTAHRYLLKHRTMQRVVQAWRMEGGRAIDRDYEQRVQRADWTFLHQVVYDVQRHECCHLTPLQAEHDVDWAFLGCLWPSDLARAVCKAGIVCPVSHRPFSDPPTPQSPPIDAADESTKENQSSTAPLVRHPPATVRHSGLFKPSAKKRPSPGMASSQPVSGQLTIKEFFRPMSQ